MDSIFMRQERFERYKKHSVAHLTLSIACSIACLMVAYPCSFFCDINTRDPILMTKLASSKKR